MHSSVPTSYTAFCDNNSIIHIAKNPTFHERTKHIKLDCQLFDKKFVDDLIHLLYVPYTSQLADMFTKSLHLLLFCFSGLLLPNWDFTIFMPTLRGGDKDIDKYIIYMILLYYYQIFCFIRFYFFFYMMRHCTLYFE